VRVKPWNLDAYIVDVYYYLVRTGFQDRKLSCTATRFGDMATVCGFEGMEGTKVVERGVAMYQLFYDGQCWWINSVGWNREGPGNLIPREYFTESKSFICANN
jgi:hypothetical protein